LDRTRYICSNGSEYGSIWFFLNNAQNGGEAAIGRRRALTLPTSINKNSEVRNIMDKSIAIVVAGAQGQEIKDITIKPGTTTSDILKSVGLERYVLSKRDGKIFAPRDNVFEAVDEGEKLFASAEAEVGFPGLRSFFNWAKEIWDSSNEDLVSPKVAILGTRSIPPINVIVDRFLYGEDDGPQPQLTANRFLPETSVGNTQRTVIQPQRHTQAILVQRQPSYYWQDSDWSRSGQSYCGYFSAKGRKYPGVIDWDKHGLKYCLVSNPPGELWNHPHGSCFTYAGDGKYQVHFKRRPENVDGVILAVEKILQESLRRNKGR
jgi:hypothetical protein